jgi:hypothetical protein
MVCYEPFFRNLAGLPVRHDNGRTMPETPESPAQTAPEGKPANSKPRPFRVKLRGSILALLQLPNRRQVRGKLHQLSVTGGLLNVEKPLDEKLKVEVIFHLGETTIREKAEMLFPMWATHGWLQPFRFIDISEANKKVLETNLLAFVQQAQDQTQVSSQAAGGNS